MAGPCTRIEPPSPMSGSICKHKSVALHMFCLVAREGSVCLNVSSGQPTPELTCVPMNSAGLLPSQQPGAPPELRLNNTCFASFIFYFYQILKKKIVKQSACPAYNTGGTSRSVCV